MSIPNAITNTFRAIGPHQPRKLDDKAARQKVFGALWFLLLLQLAAIFTYLISCFASIGLALLIAVGGIAAGSFLGFLFGIPRARKRDDEDGGSSYQPNTNLEQVSDWLTKIIIGVSLVESREIVSGLDRLIGELKPGLVISGDPYAFLWSIIVSSFFIGLLGGYLITRVYLPVMFRNADLSSMDEQRAIAEEVVRSHAERNAEAIRLAEFQLSEGPARMEVSPEQLYEAIRIATQNVKSDIYFKARRFRIERSGGAEARRAELIRALPIFDALIRDDEASNKQPLFHSNYAQRAFVLLHTSPPDYWNAKLALDKAIAVRDRLGEKDHRHYELCRAIAQLAGWKFNGHDSPELHAAVHRDLKQAFKELNEIYDTQHKEWIEEWIRERGITDLVIPEE